MEGRQTSGHTGIVDRLIRELPLDQFKHVTGMCCRDQGDTPEENLVLKALAFAHEHHAGQRRRSGEDYITHPIAAAEILAGRLGLKDPELIAAAILHDIVEDVADLNIMDIETRFGKNVAAFVDGCTKLKSSYLDPTRSKDLTYKKMLQMASTHPEILLIKMADRLHNMETLSALPENRRQRIAHETMEVYAPLAAKLNLFNLKRRLFHLAIMQRFPKKSKRLMGMLKKVMASDEIKEMHIALETAFALLGFPVDVKSRTRNLWSFYSPARKNLSQDNAENLVDFTIVLDSEQIPECYRVLGILNQLYSPVPKSIRDYIANPKTNGYQSLHVRILCRERKYLVKIRTRHMDLVARKGALLNTDNKAVFSEYRRMISDLLKSIGEFEGSPSGRKHLIRQLSDDEQIFVYTPDGDMEYLPQGSVVLDFAYRVHTSLGNRCEYAWVNDRRVSPGHPLKDGDTVKIVTSAKRLDVGPGFEQICKTPKARNAVNKYLQKQRRGYAARIGRDFLLQEMKRHDLDASLLETPGMDHYLTYKGYDGIEKLFEDVGQDKLRPREILWEVASVRFEDDADHVVTPDTVINVDRLEGGVHKFSMCCNPLPGLDHTIAILSRRGVSFHRDSCRQYMGDDRYTADKRLKVVWDMGANWKEQLKFKLFVKGKSVNGCMELLSRIPGSVTIHRVEQAGERGGVDILVSLPGFKAARGFFTCFEEDDCRVIIEGYGRDRINF